jgi:tetratricopeptide (TPR) repeat protein
MRKYLLAILIILWVAVLGAEQNTSIDEAFVLLKTRKDNAALAIFEKILFTQPNNLDALWGKAEVLRRSRDYQQSEELLNKILSTNPKHVPVLISLSYIRYKDDKINEALKLINQVLKTDSLDKENRALAYMMLGIINSRRSAKGWFFSKIRYGIQIKCYFLKAKELAPHLPEVHLGLGTFYLKAPAVVGGNLDRAFQELELAVKIAPDFATANARLAQAYKKKGNLEKYNFYIRRARELDPKNEVLKEIKD